MKPGDHPDFFRFPAPEGRSRESTIVLGADGLFRHDGVIIEHEGLANAMHTWIARHPDDGRFILTNGYDWTYFTVEDAPYTVRTLHISDAEILLELSDGSLEPWAPESTRIGRGDILYTSVKRNRADGPFEARFSRHAQSKLDSVLTEEAGNPAVVIAGKPIIIGTANN